MKNFYFTFGSDPQFPFGRDDYVLVKANDLGEAVRMFDLVHPRRPGSNCVNCAFFYEEDDFLRFKDEYYPGDPIEVLS